MEKLRYHLDRIMQALCCSLFALMVLVATWQVITRYLLGSPSTMSEAFLRVALIWLALLSIALVAGRREHVCLSAVTDKLPDGMKRIVNFCIEGIFIVFAIFAMIYGGGTATFNTMDQIYPMLQIPKGLIYMSLPATGTIILVYCILNCIDLYRSSTSTSEALS
ncbi:TRAP transporter small permease [Halomonas sp. V046]|uniref:TRAP transporter small permease n=1 Tax=Halomonas sp. V046 TaxID=3459611 RepID=UPI004044E3A8